MIVVFWLLLSGGRITLIEAFYRTWWLVPFAFGVFTITRVLPSLIALRMLRTEFAYDPEANAESPWRIANQIMRSKYPRLLKSKRDLAGSK
jgi:hypothetical protein